LTLSAIPIILPICTTEPAAMLVSKTQVSVAVCCVFKNHLPTLCACPLDVVPNVLIVFICSPYFAMAAVSFTVT